MGDDIEKQEYDPMVGGGEEAEDIMTPEQLEQQARSDMDDYLIQKAQEIYTNSTDYIDSTVTNQWERNLAHFHSEHSPGSKLSAASYKRSNIFRPKTRSTIKMHEAGIAAAAFSTSEQVTIEAVDPRNPKQRISAAVNKEVLKIRLEEHMPWFLNVVGAYQDTHVYGVCISHQHWRYEEDTDIVPAYDEFGAPIVENGQLMGEEKSRVRCDKPVCDLVEPENFRFDPMCDWRDPASTSPYLIYLMPIYANDALERMETIDPKSGQPVWREYNLGQILSTRRQDYDRTRQAREGRDRIDPADENHGNGYTMVWAHLNIIKVNGEDMAYWTMGTELILTDPVPLRELYPWLREGERPFVVGFSSVEAHRNYPAGSVEQGAPLQQELNDIVNQRLDNVKLALNKRYHVRRGSQVDLDALVRNVSGGGVYMNDPEKDVKVINTPDVTGSSYQEQDRIAVEFDELVGNFSQSSVQSNRNLNETVGGMDHMSASSGGVSDYTIKVFVETWMEPVLRQLMRLVQRFETDPDILTVAFSRAQASESFGVDQVSDEVLKADITVTANVGMGATDPMKSVEKLIFGVTQTAQLPGMAARLKSGEVTDEIFGRLGYKNSTRFYMTEDELAEMQAGQEPQSDPEMDLRNMELQIRDQDTQLRHEREMMKLNNQYEVEMSRIASTENIKLEELYSKLGIEDRRVQMQRDIAALRETNKQRELTIKQATGSGI